VFEVKQDLNPTLLQDAAEKAASVRRLRRTSVPFVSAGALQPAVTPRDILAGILAVRSRFGRYFQNRVTLAIEKLPRDQLLDFGCPLLHGAFEMLPEDDTYSLHFSPSSEALIFFFIRLVERLRAQGTAPAADLMAYAHRLKSLHGYPGQPPAD